MSADTGKHDENGNGNRATVALVDSKVDTIRVLVEGGFKDVQRQLDGLNTLPGQVGALHERQVLLEARVTVIEDADKTRRAFRWGPLPTILFGLCGVILAGVNIYLVVALGHA